MTYMLFSFSLDTKRIHTTDISQKKQTFIATDIADVRRLFSLLVPPFLKNLHSPLPTEHTQTEPPHAIDVGVATVVVAVVAAVAVVAIIGGLTVPFADAIIPPKF